MCPFVKLICAEDEENKGEEEEIEGENKWGDYSARKGKEDKKKDRKRDKAVVTICLKKVMARDGLLIHMMLAEGEDECFPHDRRVYVPETVP